MSIDELVQLVKKPPMYGAYYLVKKPSGWRLMLRVFASVEVEWDSIAPIADKDVATLEAAGVERWK
jgi:hypothetical protein